MIFYKIIANSGKIEIPEEAAQDRLRRVFKSKTRRMTQSRQAKVMICVTDLDTECISMAAIIDAEYALSHPIEKLATDYLNECGINSNKIKEEEISF